MPWYTDNPRDPGNRSPLFVAQVHMVRGFYQMQKVAPGVDRSNFWREFTLQSHKVFVNIAQFEYAKIVNFQGVAASGEAHLFVGRGVATPEFSLMIRMGWKAGQPFWQNTLKIYFPTDYPSSHPTAVVDNPRYAAVTVPHEHHCFTGGVLCNFAEYDDWNPRRDTTVSFINASLNLLVWHFKKHGW